MEHVVGDIRFGIRALLKRPGFAAIAIVTLGLGIGANTAMFSVIRGVLLRPLPYRAPDELVSLWTRYLPESGLEIPQFPLSPEEVVDYRDETEALEAVIPYRTTDVTLSGDERDPARIHAGVLGAGMLELLGARPSLGRAFAPEEEAPGAPPAILLSHELWRARFGGDPGVIGRTVRVNGETAEIVGVMPESFVFPTARSKLWTPLGLDEGNLPNRANHFLLAVGRLADGATLAEAKAELGTISAAWRSEYDHHKGHFIFLRDLRSDLIGDTGRTLWLLMLAVGLVLLIACVNVANLLLARGEDRQDEIGLRLALGAGRFRVIRQLLTESSLLSLAGAGLGMVLAAWATPALVAINPNALPRSESVSIDWSVLSFSIALAALTALFFGMVPALRASGERLATLATRVMSEARSTADRTHMRFRRGLVAVEVALSLVVVAGAGLVARSFLELTSVESGMQTESVLTFALALPSADYETQEEVPLFYAQLLERLRGLPGIRSAAATSSLPLLDEPTRADFQVEDEPLKPPGVPKWNADLLTVHPGYFRTLGIPLRRGRLLTEMDGPDDRLVALINEATARRYWPGEDPVGRRITYQAGADTVPWITIVGVVGDVRTAGLDAEPRPQIYLPHRQLARAQGSTGRWLTIVARVAGDPGRLTPAVRRTVAELDPDLPLANLQTMEQVAARSVARPRMATNLLSSFALIALTLAAVGIYGVISYSVSRRTREIGIRIALGAERRAVSFMVLRESLVPVAVGLLAGLAIALTGSRLLSGLLFGVSEHDPLTFAAVLTLLAGVAATASYLPSLRATRIDPMEALRHE